MQLQLDNEEHLLKLHDTAGQEEYERIRQVIYKEVSAVQFSMCVFVLVSSMNGEIDWMWCDLMSLANAFPRISINYG